MSEAQVPHLADVRSTRRDNPASPSQQEDVILACHAGRKAQNNAPDDPFEDVSACWFVENNR